jgi:hypothetical protein
MLEIEFKNIKTSGYFFSKIDIIDRGIDKIDKYSFKYRVNNISFLENKVKNISLYF